MKPLISIIIPTYNRAHLISETLDSIISQNYSNWECIVVDDGSTDDTEEIINVYLKDNRFQFHKRPESRPKGANSCRNYGFQLSKGDYIKWFDSDDIMLPNLFQKQFNTICKAQVFVCKIVKYNFETSTALGINKIQSQDLIEDYFTGKIAFYVSGASWERNFLEKQFELFDEKISNLDDWDFNLRMLYENPVITYIDEPLIKYRMHENSLSNEIEKLNFHEIKSEMLAREKHIKLIKQNKKANVPMLKRFIVQRYKYFFREAMVQKNKYRYYYVYKLLQKEVDLLDFKGVLKTLFGLIVFSVFNKGYKLLK